MFKNISLANCSLQWQPGQVQATTVTPVALLSGVGMILVAVAFVLYAAVRRLGWGYLGWGALGWVVAVALKFVWAIPINGPVYNALLRALPKAIAAPIFYIYVGALTGVFEVLLIWLVLRYTRLGQVPWPRALAFGIGFGALEALLLGASSLANVLTAMLMPSVVPVAAMNAIARANDVLYALAPVVERAATVFLHIGANVLLFYGVRQARGRARWLWLAFLYKTAIDSVAAFAQFWGLETVARVWTIEAIVVLFGLAGWWITRWVARHYPVELPGEVIIDAPGAPPTEPAAQ
jgi:uncharacterized membrane protein YhfC